VGSEPGRDDGGSIGRRAGTAGLLHGDGAGGRLASDGERRPALPGGGAMSGLDGDRRPALAGVFNRDGDRYPVIRAGGAVSTADAGTASRVSFVT